MFHLSSVDSYKCPYWESYTLAIIYIIESIKVVFFLSMYSAILLPLYNNFENSSIVILPMSENGTSGFINTESIFPSLKMFSSSESFIVSETSILPVYVLVKLAHA